MGPDDAELELIRRSGVAIRTGRLSLSAGAGSYRVKESMARVGRALGIDSHEAHVTLTEITTTSRRGSSFRTEVTEVRSVGIDADRLARLERMASALERRGRPSTVPEVSAELDQIASARPLYGLGRSALWSALACSAFAFLIGGGPIEMLAAAIGAGTGQAVRRRVAHGGRNPFAVTVLAAVAACLAYLCVVQILHVTGATDDQHGAGYVSAVLFLVPGFPLVTSALDLTRLDFSAGVARLTYALMVLASVAPVVWGVSVAMSLPPDALAEIHVHEPWLVLLRLAMSFVGVMGFALLFNSPWPMALGAAGVGMVANVARLTLLDAGAAPQAAAFVAAVAVGLLSALVAPRLDVPRTTIAVPAVVIMVPGGTAYRGVVLLSNGATTDALGYAVEFGLVIAALGAGLAAARMLTDRGWGLVR